MRKEYNNRHDSKLVNGPITLRANNSGAKGWDAWDVILLAGIVVNAYVWLVVAGISGS